MKANTKPPPRAALAVAVVAATSIAMAACGGPHDTQPVRHPVTVPGVVGKQVGTAKAEIKAAHLKVATRYTAGGPARHRPRSGTVLLEQPHAGSKVAKDAVVHLTVQQ